MDKKVFSTKVSIELFKMQTMTFFNCWIFFKIAVLAKTWNFFLVLEPIFIDEGLIGCAKYIIKIMSELLD